MLKQLIILFFIAALLPDFASAATITANSCNQSDVQTAIISADYGDTVVIPPGTCTWSSGIEFDKDIRIIGSGTDLTTLILNFTDDSVYEAFFKFTPDATSRDNLDSLDDVNTFEVSDINFIGNNSMRYKYGVWISNSNLPVIKRVNIHNNKFSNIHRAVQTYYYVHGVFHNNILENTNGNYPMGIGHQAFYNDRMMLGSGAGWYIEDNEFSYTGIDGLICGAGNRGGGYVVRYNTVTGTLVGGSTYVETHGNQLSYIYGPQITEVYGNNMPATGVGKVTNARGGKNIYLNNVFADDDMQIWEEFSDLATSPTNPVGRCPENQGVERQTCNDSCICQKVHDSYFINNRLAGTGTVLSAYVAMDYENRNDGILNDPPELVEDIEFFNHIPSGFDGTSGVGCGTLAEMNAITTCNEGVGFWATDQSCSDLTGMIGANPTEPIDGTLYKCVSGTWETFYEPYTYPHPLRQEDIIPQERKIDWSQAGVEGGIPTRTTICATIDAATYGNGVTDASGAIQSALDSCPSGQVVYLPAGEYFLASSIILGSYVTLRGAGPDQTILLGDDIGSIVVIGASRSNTSGINIVSGYTKGSEELVLEDASTITVGSYLRVDELNNDTIPVTNVGYGTCTWCGRDYGNRVRGQFVKVTGKNGNNITISPEMYFTFSADKIPQVQGQNYGIGAEYSGIEDLTIKNDWNPSKVQGTDGKEYSSVRDHTSSSDGSDRPVTGDWDYYWLKTGEDGSSFPQWQPNTAYEGDYSNSRVPLNIMNTANCWAKNIKIERCGSRCVQFQYNNYRFELRDSHITKCINKWDSNNCYGTLIGSYTSGTLIENNIYESVSDGPMFAWSASGNVVGYNYIYDCHRVNVMRTWFQAIGAAHHGSHTSYNLWEGNEMEAAYFDQYWGSHSHNTMFRNRIIGKYMVDGIAVDNIQAIHSISTEKNVHYQNYIGNVLGTDNYHDKYENNCIGCPNGYYDKLIYRTGYVSSGSCSTDDDDPETFNTMLRHMNYDYVSDSVKHCGDAGEPNCQGTNGDTILPDSLYYSSKPDWYGSAAWPAIGPDLNPMTSDIPAKMRFEAMQNPQACVADLGGSCCTPGQVCQGGSFQSSSDCGDCCVGGVCQDPPPTCSELGGYCCTGSAICEGTDLGTTSDCTGTCCSQSCTVPDATVLSLHLDEGSGSIAADSSGNGNDADIIGATWTTDSKSGSHALSLNGIDNYINISDSPSLDFDKSYGTIEFWIKPINPADGNYQLLVVDSDYEIEFNLQGDGDLFYYPYYSPTDWHNYNLVTNPLTAGEWHHVAATWNYDTREASIYVNGIEQVYTEENVNPTNWITIASTGDWHIGGSPVKNQYFAGIIDEIKVFSSALSPAEILDHYNQGSYHLSDTNKNGCIEIGEMVAFMDRWKISSEDVGMSELMESIGLWKSGLGCY